MAPFQRRERKHRRRKDASRPAYDGDSNLVELLPAEQAARKRQREALRRELTSEQPKISSKKKKRLDKYIVSPVVRQQMVRC